MDVVRFFAELKRRRVFRVAAAYAVVGFAVAEAIDLLLPRLGAPEWAVSVFLVAILAGFPIALVLAWALEVTPDGVRVTAATDDHGSAASSGAASGSRAGYTVVFLLGALLSLGAWWVVDRARGVEDGPDELRSLAVLPFAALSDDTDDQWLAQGLHDQLITELSRLAGLDRVISRTSVLQYAEDPPPVTEIARTLNVDAVIEGSILPSSDRVRINVQLIAGATDHHLWSQDYDRARAEALDLVKSVALDIAGEIQLQLSADDAARLEAERSVSPAAQEAYFRGRAAWNERTEEGMARAAEQFRRAIEIDPDYAQAYAGMASFHALGWGAGADRARAVTFANRALELDPGLAEAYTARGYARMLRDHDWDAAESDLRAAVRVQPGYATAHQWGAELLVAIGRPAEAVAWIRRARELDPFSGIIAWNELRILYLTGRFDECLAANDRYDAEFADYTRDGNRVACLLGAGRYPEAAALGDAPDSVQQAVGPADGRALWEWVAEESERSSLSALAQLGRYDALFERIDDWFAEPGGPGLNLPILLADPLLDPAREDPRWREKVLDRVGLPNRSDRRPPPSGV